MSASNRRSERLEKKRSVPVPDLQVPGTRKESKKIVIDDVALLLTIKPIVANLLEYINEVEDHTDSEQKQLGNDDPMAVERLKYTQLRDIYLKVVHKEMFKYLQLYRKKVETDKGVQVTKKIAMKFVGLPRVFNRFPYMCIHNSWIVTRDGDNVMVACPLRARVSLNIYRSVVYEVYSATLEYATVGLIADDINEGMQFLRGKMTEYVQELLATDFEETTSILRRLLQKIVFVRYPPPNKRENILLYLKENFRVFCHWQTYLATVYYQTDNLGDALLYASHYTPPNEVQSKPIPRTTTNIKNIAVNESFFDVSTAIRELTVTEQFKIIRPLVVSILRSIDMFSDEYRGQLQARRNNPHYEYLRMQTCTYAKFLLDKMTCCMNSNWTDAIDGMDLPSTSTSANPGVNSASKEISNEIKTAIKQLFFIIDAGSK
ncbi:conserved hypothetical protein [Cotesia vestalis bracovirus]|nr:conserved hypothetical protein [Cotesia vestalis bracovirus]